MEWIFERIKEPSTVRGVLMLVGVAGVNIAPDLSASIVSTVGAVAGLIEIIRKETKAG